MTIMITPNSIRSLDTVTTIDGFDLAVGARLATKADYEKHVRPVGMLFMILTQALAAAADDSGLITDHEDHTFFDSHVMDVLGLEPDEVTTPVTYDAFTAMTLMESRMELIRLGYLAHKGKGDSMDLHLALPAEE
jgi:hypothetical protein